MMTPFVWVQSLRSSEVPYGRPLGAFGVVTKVSAALGFQFVLARVLGLGIPNDLVRGTSFVVASWMAASTG